MAVQDADPGSLLNLYRLWAHARAQHEALRTGDFVSFDVGQRSILAFTRSTPTESILVAINMGKTESEAVRLSMGEGISTAKSALDGTVIAVHGEVDLGIMAAQSGGIWVLD